MHWLGILATIAVALVALPSGPARSDEAPTAASGAASEFSALAGEWVATEFEGAPTVADAPITIIFEDGRVSGRASCNRYGASAALADGRLTIGEAMKTRMACPEPVMEQETRFAAFIGSPLTLSVEPDGSLLLTSPDGTTLRAARA